MIHHRDHHPAYSEGGEAEVDKPWAQRAVFDVDFSQIGRCQIDALCQDRRFDLLLRSERALAPAHRQQITDLFHSACEIAGLTGEIGYRQGEFVEPARRSTSMLTVST
jgi:hypothetical protein